MTPKEKYFKKVYENAKEIPCACGCGQLIKNKDKYGRDKNFISGHNTERKYIDPTQYKREWNHRNRKYRMGLKKEHYRKYKVQMIKIKGSKCLKCGVEYNGINAPMFQFHHRNPKEKEFNIHFTKYGWKRNLKEAEKCDLLCANCHELHHAGEF